MTISNSKIQRIFEEALSESSQILEGWVSRWVELDRLEKDSENLCKECGEERVELFTSVRCGCE